MSNPILLSERLLLRKFEYSDVEAFHELLKDEEVNAFLPWFPHQDIEETKVFLYERYIRFNCIANTYHYAICLKDSEQVIGYIQIGDGDAHDLGYGLLKAYWHQGIVSEACHMLLEQLHKDGFPFITATHDICNMRSGGVMRNIGMKYQYTYEECVEPKKQMVTFRLYQLNIAKEYPPYPIYWDTYSNHFIEEDI